MRRSWIIVLAGALTACSAPTLSPIGTPGTMVADPALIGEWTTDPPTVTRVVITQGPGKAYAATLTIHDKGEFKASLALEVSLTQIGPHRFADLFLAKVEREELAHSYGFLALPVHQMIRIKLEGDRLEAAWFDSAWMRKAAPENGLACEVLPIGGDDVPVLTGPTAAVRAFLEANAGDPGALEEPLVFHRVRK